MAMAEAANIDEPHRDVRDQNKTASASADEGKDRETANLPNDSDPKPEKSQSGNNGVEQPKQPSILKRIWGKLGLDFPTALMMFKLACTSNLPLLSFANCTLN
jgi:hypothetical protein